jgi:ubiquinone/menaquinone biosynthesis C-methylase UbiE
MSDTNGAQIEFWNGPLGRHWVANQERLDRVWQTIGEPAIACARVRPGERVVDVGCGCGATALDLAAKVGPSGSVFGVDISGPMVARARERASALTVPNLEFVQADASTYAFAGDADLVFSRAGVMYFADPVGAFTNLRRALRPGGRLVFVCFRGKELNSWWTVPLAAAASAITADAAPPTRAADTFSLADQTPLRAMLDGAGFADAVCEAVDHDVVLGSDVDAATDFSLEAGPAQLLLAGVSDEVRTHVRQVVREALTQHVGSTGVSLRAATWIVQAINPITADTAT